LVANVSNLTNRLIDNKNIDPCILSDEEFKRKIIEEVTPHIDDEVQVIEVVNVEDDTGPFPKIEQQEMKIEQTPQVLKHFENFEQTPEEITEFEKMIGEDRKNELRKLAHHQGLRHETYNLINKQFEREIARYPIKTLQKNNLIISQKIIQEYL
jgi:hypothetical protein